MSDTPSPAASVETGSSSSQSAHPALTSFSSATTDAQAIRDQMLDEIRSSRRLDRIVMSMEGFLNHQTDRLEAALGELKQSVDNDRIVQDILERHEQEKNAWKLQRADEMARLAAAGEELTRAWEKLEDERRVWMENRDRLDQGKTR